VAPQKRGERRVDEALMADLDRVPQVTPGRAAGFFGGFSI
jgi:hypothetical protein